MKEDILLMQKLFDAYHVSYPVEGYVQDYTLRMKRKNLIRLMKKLGIYSSSYGAILFIYFLFKKLGIGLTIVQSAGVLFVTSMVAAVSIGAGGFIAVKKLVQDTPARQEKALYGELMTEANRTIDARVRGEDYASGVAVQGTIISFQGLTNNGADPDLVKQVSDSMMDEFAHVKDRGVIIQQGLSNARYILSGSVDKLDNQYQISIKLTDRRSRKIVFASSDESDTQEGLTISVKKIAREISDRL